MDLQDEPGLRAQGRLVVGERACGWWCRPRAGAHPPWPARRGCGTSRRSRPARRGSPAPRGPRPNVLTASSTAAALLFTTATASRAQQPLQPGLGVHLALAARRRPRGRTRGSSRTTAIARHAGGRRGRQGRPAQVGVDDHAGGVDDAHQRGSGAGAQALLDLARKRRQRGFQRPVVRRRPTPRGSLPAGRGRSSRRAAGRGARTASASAGARSTSSTGGSAGAGRRRPIEASVLAAHDGHRATIGRLRGRAKPRHPPKRPLTFRGAALFSPPMTRERAQTFADRLPPLVPGRKTTSPISPTRWRTCSTRAAGRGPSAWAWPSTRSPARSTTRALELARRSPGVPRAPGRPARVVHGARSDVEGAGELRDLFQLVGARPGTEVLVDRRRVPYAREIWLPLFWIFVSRRGDPWPSKTTSTSSKRRSASSRSSGTSSSAASSASRPPTSRPAWRR